MNGYSFTQSAAAVCLLAAGVVFLTWAALTAIWVVDLWSQGRRDARAKELRLQRARRPRVRPLAFHLSRTAASERSVARRAEYARSVGVDEERAMKAIGVDEDFHLWAERSR